MIETFAKLRCLLVGPSHIDALKTALLQAWIRRAVQYVNM